MKLISKKELTPISYGEMGYKVMTLSINPNDICFSDHWHDRIEILRILEGDMHFSRNDVCVDVKEGELAIVCPKQLHGAVAGENGVKYTVLMFDTNKFLNGVFSTEKLLKPIFEQKVLFAPSTKNKKIIGLVDELINLTNSNSDEDKLYSIGIVYVLISQLIKHCLVENKEFAFFDESFSVVINYIHENYTKKISSATVSKRFNYDEAYFCRKFKTITGTTLMKYIKKLRLDMAKHLLDESNNSILNVSKTCGFTDVTYFSRCFKYEFGISPSEYLNTYKKRQKI